MKALQPFYLWLFLLIDLRYFPLICSSLLLLQALSPPPFLVFSCLFRSKISPADDSVFTGGSQGVPIPDGIFKPCSMLLIFPTFVFLPVAQNNHHREASWRRCEQMSESPHLAPVNKAKHWLCVTLISLSYFKTKHL